MWLPLWAVHNWTRCWVALLVSNLVDPTEYGRLYQRAFGIGSMMFPTKMIATVAAESFFKNALLHLLYQLIIGNLPSHSGR